MAVSVGADGEILLTPEGLRRLEAELEELRTVRRPQVANRIKQALEFGDISENAEYDAAKGEQAFVEGRIAALEAMLGRARIIDATEVSESAEVSVGSRVRLEDMETGETMEFALVGPAEADPSEARISYASPVGRAILGRAVGDQVEVEAPAGRLRYRILGITGGMGYVPDGSEAAAPGRKRREEQVR